MCTSPILIKNPKYKNLIVTSLNSYISVPCGRCDECLQKRSNSVYVRARFEYDECLRSGGVGFMCCLTYDNSQLPTLNYEGKSYLVFNKKHVIDFIKRLRTNLDRYYQKNYGTDAPDFKYLISSEFGSLNHRPHYHPLFFFRKYISHYAFRTCFVQSLFDRRAKKAVFGKIYQCDILDPQRGGIKYSAKYVLKEQSFAHNDKIIRDIINFEKDKINAEFGIDFVKTDVNTLFRNQCLRKSKDYIRAVRTRVLPYRHMLQFYMCSNDLGTSVIINHYGEDLYHLHCLNLDGYEYCIPKIVSQTIRKFKGDLQYNKLSKGIFLDYLYRGLDSLALDKKISQSESKLLKDFASLHVQPRAGSFDIIYDKTSDYYDLTKNPIGLADWDLMLNHAIYFDDNDFYRLRYRLLQVLAMLTSPSKLQIRSKIVARRLRQQQYEIDKKNRNKNKIY